MIGTRLTKIISIIRSRVFLIKLSIAIIMSVGLMVQGASPSLSASTIPLQVFVIPVYGEVEPVMASYIKRVVAIATSSGPDTLIILEMDTFGGRVDAALEIVDTMTNISNIQTIAFVKSKAISAGALISLSCNKLVMRPHTTLGDCAPISFANNEAKMLGEKFQSPLRAKFRTLARRNGYPAVLAESMVTAKMEVYKVRFPDKTVFLNTEDLTNLSEAQRNLIKKRSLVVNKGELLTMDDTEAIEFGFSQMTALSVNEMLEKMAITDFSITRLEQNWAEKWGRKIVMISPLLMIIGMAALYTELKAPGFGLPGIVGLTCLGLVLFNQHLIGLANHLEFLLVALGLIMFGFEIFVIPGFGIAGISGFLFMGAGLILSFQNFIIPDPEMPWQADIFFTNLTDVLGAFFISFILSLATIRYLLPRLGLIIDGPYLDETLVSSHADSHEAMEIIVGQTGMAATSLRPAGKMNIGHKNIDVITTGDFIEKGRLIKVKALEGNRVIVTED